MISLKNVSYTYKNGYTALKDINLDIKTGEITMIIGKNGSGKSTLGNVISRIITNNKGTIILDNKTITKRTKSIDIRRKISIVFQNPNNQIIFNRVYDDIAFTLNNLNVEPLKINNIINDSLDIVDMKDYIYNNPYELSLGQKQRIAIAGAIASNPKYLVLDEPTSMLDSNGKKDIYKVVKNLSKRNIGIVFITNMIEEILIAENIVVIDKGKIIKTFKKKDIIENIDLLKNIGLEIPFIIKLILNLKQKNINLINFEEDEILSIINNLI